MKSRIFTALLMLIPSVYLIGWSPPWLFLLALVLLVEWGMFEFFALTRAAGMGELPGLGYAAGCAVCLAQWVAVDRTGLWVIIVLALSVMLALILAMAGSRGLSRYVGTASTAILGVLYVGFALSCIVPIRFSPKFSGMAPGNHLLMFLFVVVWSGDIFAYGTGRILGRHLMFPEISPKKTIEGAIGGFLGSVIMGWAYAEKFWAISRPGIIIFLAALVAVSGQVGDLVESAMKRNANVKDSGRLLPGHGGILDRIDSVLFAAPALWLALILRDLLISKVRW